MTYGVKYVGDNDLPDEVEWAFLKPPGTEDLVLCIKASAVCSRVLSEAWAAYRQIEQPRSCIKRHMKMLPEAVRPDAMAV